jgi:hypothetical protein
MKRKNMSVLSRVLIRKKSQKNTIEERIQRYYDIAANDRAAQGLNDVNMLEKYERTMQKLRKTKERLEYINSKIEISKETDMSNRTIH